MTGATAIAPHPAPLRLLSLGHTGTAATLTWMATTLHFIADAPDPAWIRRGVLTTGALDPDWDTAWVYGAVMLLSIGDDQGHRDVLEAAAEARPAQPWYPAALAISLYGAPGNERVALDWMERAAQLPAATPLHSAIAANWRRDWETP